MEIFKLLENDLQMDVGAPVLKRDSQLFIIHGMYLSVAKVLNSRFIFLRKVIG